MTSLLSSPELGANTLVPRDYQQVAFDAVRAEFAAGRKRTLIVHATGTGKTIVGSLIARAVVERGGRCLILAHREELLGQWEDALDRVGIASGREKAESFARSTFDPSVVVASVPTLRGKRLETWDRGYFRLIIVDEAHHATAASYTKILQHFRSAHVLGVTATLWRADEDELADVFNSVAHAYPMLDAILAGDLCRPLIVQRDIGVDLTGLRRGNGDFSLDDLAARIKPAVEQLANLTHQEMEDRPTLVFMPDVSSAQGMATALDSLGRSAEWVAGLDPDRAEKIRRYRNGDLQTLACCDLLTEGFDAPKTAALGLYRATNSPVVASQQVGRGTRKGKPNVKLIDPGYMAEKFALFSPIDLFDTNETDFEVLDIARDLVADGKTHDLIDVIEQARGIFAERQVLRIKARERELRGRRVCYDPVAVIETLGLSRRGSVDARHNRATEGQCATLAKFGVTNPESMSKRRASRMIDELIARREKGLATVRQTSILIKYDVPPDVARAMSFQEASEAIDRFFGRAG